MFSTEEEARAHVQEQVRAAEQRRHDADEMVGALDRLRVSATSSEQEVTVTLGHGGNVTDVVFDRIDGLDAAQLGSAFLEANRAAQRQVVAQVEQLAERHYGKDTATARVVSSQYRDMFAPPPEDEPGQDAAGTPGGRR